MSRNGCCPNCGRSVTPELGIASPRALQHRRCAEAFGLGNVRQRVEAYASQKAAERAATEARDDGDRAIVVKGKGADWLVIRLSVKP